MTDYTIKIKACLYELQESKEFLPEKFQHLYELHKLKLKLADSSVQASTLWTFVGELCRSYKQVKKYYEQLLDIIKQDPVLEPICESVLRYLETHYGRNSVHKVVYHSQDHNSIKLALQKLISDVKDWRIGQAAKRGIVYTFFDLLEDPADQFAGRTEEHYLLSKEGEYLPNFYYHQWQADRRLTLFRRAVQDEELRQMVEEFIALIDERNMNLGSEEDLRYFSDQTQLFEAPYTALLEYSDKYIVDFIDSYSLTYRWYNHLPENPNVQLILEKHFNSPYMKNFYAASMHRLSGNDPYCPEFSPWLLEQIKSSAFVQELLLMCATDAIRSAQVCYSEQSFNSIEDIRNSEDFLRDLHGVANSLEEDSEIVFDDESDFQYYSSTFFSRLVLALIGEAPNSENAERFSTQYQELQRRVADNIRGILDGSLEPAFEPCYGYKSSWELRSEQEKSRRTEAFFELHNIEKFAYVHYQDKPYILNQVDEKVYITDVNKLESVSFRELSNEGLYDTVFALQPTLESPAHFVTLNWKNGLVEAWHLGQAAPVYALRANACSRDLTTQLSNDGRVLLLTISNFIDPDSDITPDILDLQADSESVVVVIDLAKGEELCRFEVDFTRTIKMSPNGQFALMCKSGSFDRSDVFTKIDLQTGATETLAFPAQSALGSDEFAISHNSQWLVYKHQIIDVETCERIGKLIGDDFTFCYEFSQDDKYIIAYTSEEAEKAIFEVKTGSHLGTIYGEEDRAATYQSYIDSEQGVLYSLEGESIHFYDIGDMLGLDRAPLSEPEYQAGTVWNNPIGPKVARREGSFSYAVHGIELSLTAFGSENQQGNLRLAPPLVQGSTVPALGGDFSVTCEGMGRVFGFMVKLTHPEINQLTETKWQVIGKLNQLMELRDPFTAEERQAGRYTFEVYSLDEQLLFARQVIDIRYAQEVNYEIKPIAYGSFFGDKQDHVANKKAAVNYDNTCIGYHLKVSCEERNSVVALKSRIYRVGNVEETEGGHFKKFDITKTTNASDETVLDLTIQGEDHNSYIEGTWAFEVIDVVTGGLVFSDTIDIYPQGTEFNDCKTLLIESIDHGIYQAPEGFDYTERRVSHADDAQLIEQTSEIQPKVNTLYGVKFKVKDECPDAIYRITVEQWATGQEWVCSDDGNERYKKYSFFAQRGEVCFASWTIAEEYELFYDMSRIIVRHGPMASPLLHDFHAEKEVSS